MKQKMNKVKSITIISFLLISIMLFNVSGTLLDNKYSKETLKENNKQIKDKNMGNKIEKAKALGRDSIVKAAINIIKNKYPTLKINLSDFEITAWSNKKNILANFKRLIKFSPLGSEHANFDYDLSINIETKEVSPIDTWGINNFYIPTEEDIQKIKFVKKAFNLPISGFDNAVIEKADMYVINLENEISYGRYHIDKVTGEELIGSIQGSYVPNPNPDNGIEEYPLIEIKE